MLNSVFNCVCDVCCRCVKVTQMLPQPFFCSARHLWLSAVMRLLTQSLTVVWRRQWRLCQACVMSWACCCCRIQLALPMSRWHDMSLHCRNNKQRCRKFGTDMTCHCTVLIISKDVGSYAAVRLVLMVVAAHSELGLTMVRRGVQWALEPPVIRPP